MVSRSSVLGLLGVVAVLGWTAVAGAQELRLGNGHASVAFHPETGALTALDDAATGHRHIAPGAVLDLWTLRTADGAAIGPSAAGSFSASAVDGGLELVWGDFGIDAAPDLRVAAAVAFLDGHDTAITWRIRVDGLGQLAMADLVYPRIGPLAPQDDEALAVPIWMGERLTGPRAHLGGRRDWAYPGVMSLQCLAYYRDGGPGLFLASDDTANFGKRWAVAAEPLTLELIHTPSADTAASYAPPYAAVTGVFEGDWFTAAEAYRAFSWNQARMSRLVQGGVPAWVEDTAAWVWNRGRSENVLGPAAVLQEALGLPVSVFWHWWHGCPYDAGFPEYLPPREGTEPFRAAMDRAHAAGLHALVYMNQRLWCLPTESWEREGAEAYAVKGADGEIHPEVYNVFTQTPCAPMCIGTAFWRNTYAGLATEAFHTLAVDGIYMDQACLSLPCYDPAHGHPLGGGTYWVEGFKSLAADIRSGSSGIALAGEGAGEAWLPHLDLMLTLQVSKERYSGAQAWQPIPFFQAAYGGQAIYYGNYASLTAPPYDELWPAEFAPETPLALLDAKYAIQFRLEQARAFLWGLQPTVSNFRPSHLEARRDEMAFFMRLARLRHAARAYFQYGTMLRPPALDVPEIELPMSRLSIYAGQRGGVTEFAGRAPAVLASAWQAADGGVAVALVNISGEDRSVTLPLDPAAYPMTPDAAVHRITPEGTEPFDGYDAESRRLTIGLPAQDAAVITFTIE